MHVYISLFCLFVCLFVCWLACLLGGSLLLTVEMNNIKCTQNWKLLEVQFWDYIPCLFVCLFVCLAGLYYWLKWTIFTQNWKLLAVYFILRLNYLFIYLYIILKYAIVFFIILFYYSSIACNVSLFQTLLLTVEMNNLKRWKLKIISDLFISRATFHFYLIDFLNVN